ncbi:MAG: hypothetical protein WC823_06830 [Parcubacteria group bacterium]|jgi:3-hydroxyacyl-[acyl-carrier-protein] dehydratase
MTIKIFSKEELNDVLPQKFPAQMLDRIIFDSDIPTAITGCKNISTHDLWIMGHFPDQPVFPGHCLMECCFLTALALAKIAMPQINGLPMIAQVGKTSFSLPALIGDTIQFKLTLKNNLRDKVLVFDAIITNQRGQTIAKLRDIKGVNNETILNVA